MLERKERKEKKVLHVRINGDLYDRIRDLAEDSGLSIVAFVTLSLRQSVRNWDSGLLNSKRRKTTTQAPEVHGQWPSQWPKTLPCPACEKMHDPLNCHGLTVSDLQALLQGEAIEE